MSARGVTVGCCFSSTILFCFEFCFVFCPNQFICSIFRFDILALKNNITYEHNAVCSRFGLTVSNNIYNCLFLNLYHTNRFFCKSVVFVCFVCKKNGGKSHCARSVARDCTYRFAAAPPVDEATTWVDGFCLMDRLPPPPPPLVDSG